MSAPIVPKSMYGVLTELIAAQSALNMEPTLIEGAEGPYSSDKDYWVNHSYAHISAAIEGVDGLLELEASHERLRVALVLAREAITYLPHSLAYDMTHLPKIDAALAAIPEAK